MILVVADQDVQGLAAAVIARCRQPDWVEVWDALEVELVMAAVGSEAGESGIVTLQPSQRFLRSIGR